MASNGPLQDNPLSAVPESLQSCLEFIADTIDQITADLMRAAPGEIPSILADHRPKLYRAMDALGCGILDFLADGPSPVHVEMVRTQVAGPIRAWSATSPVFNRLTGSVARGPRDFEVPALVIENRRTGADTASLALNDFYLNSIAAHALRNRFSLLTKRLLKEVALRTEAGTSPVQVLNLKCDSGRELVALADEPEFAAAQITCLDEDPSALRAARAALDGRLTAGARFVRVNALEYTRSPLWRSQHYDVAYAAVLCDYLTTDQAGALISECYDVLASGGTLVLGCPTNGIPAQERIIGDWVLGLRIFYRDEVDFGRLFAQTPFGLESLHFEREPLGGDMLVIARRH
jgi:SAM-dependent methyltransferase